MQHRFSVAPVDKLLGVLICLGVCMFAGVSLYALVRANLRLLWLILEKNNNSNNNNNAASGSNAKLWHFDFNVIHRRIYCLCFCSENLTAGLLHALMMQQHQHNYKFLLYLT